jgi:anaerobic glycerol-3-phosphate dehydrogenase
MYDVIVVGGGVAGMLSLGFSSQTNFFIRTFVMMCQSERNNSTNLCYLFFSF